MRWILVANFPPNRNSLRFEVLSPKTSPHSLVQKMKFHLHFTPGALSCVVTASEVFVCGCVRFLFEFWIPIVFCALELTVQEGGKWPQCIRILLLGGGGGALLAGNGGCAFFA